MLNDVNSLFLIRRRHKDDRLLFNICVSRHFRIRMVHRKVRQMIEEIFADGNFWLGFVTGAGTLFAILVFMHSFRAGGKQI